MSVSLFGGQASYTEALALVSPFVGNAENAIGTVATGNASSITVPGGGTSAISDIISLSAEANAAMTGAKSPSAATSAGGFGINNFSASTDTSSMSPDQYANALSTMAETMGGIGGSITFTFSDLAGSSGNPTITGSIAGEVTAAIAKAKATLAAGGQLPPPASAVDNFAQVYAQQATDGVAGRFYKSTNVNTYTVGMSKSAKASFVKAFDSQTLDIQPVTDATGVTSTETDTASFYAGAAGGGMSFGGRGSTDVTALMQTQQNVMMNYDPFFGTFVVAWGGPSAATGTSEHP